MEPLVPDVAEESPNSPAEVAPRLIGAVIGATTWVPEAMPSDPDVEAPEAAGAEPPVEPLEPDVADESPSTPAEVEPTLTGAVIGATTCVPEPKPSDPDVEAPEPVPAGEAAEPPPLDVAAESPATPTAVAPMLTGTEIGATT